MRGTLANVTQLHLSNPHVPYHTTGHSQSTYTPGKYDSSLGYAIGRVLRAAYHYMYGIWQMWQHPGPTSEQIVQQRQAAIYREGLEVAINQLHLAIENIRKNPRAANSLERFKQVISDYQKYLLPAPTEKLRVYQEYLFSQIRTKIQHLKSPTLKEMVLAYLPALPTEGTPLEVGVVSPINTENLPNIEIKRGVALSSFSLNATTMPVSYTTPFPLDSLNGNNGFAVTGLSSGDCLGSSVSTAGDINGDGKADLVLGAYHNGTSMAGAAYVLFGQASGWPSQFDFTSLNGSNGFVINGVNEDDQLGSSVSTAGDVNGDGIDDLLLGAWYASPYGRLNAGVVYVLFGQASGWLSQFDLNSLNGSNGFVINGVNEGDHLGNCVSTAGDINGDGKADLVLGADGKNDYSGTAYVLFGSASGWTSNFELSSLNGGNGFTINSVYSGDTLGDSVSTAGDINDDGIADLVLGADGLSVGTVYVLFGQTSGWTSNFELSSLNGGNGFTINSVNLDDTLGISVSTAGDINGDGKVDLVLGAPNASPDGRSEAGTVYVVFGQASGWPSQFNLTSLTGNNGFAIDGVNASDNLGWSVSTAGDVNGDGMADLVLGAPNASPGGRSEAGTVYVVFGQASGWPSRFNLTSLTGSNGFAVEGLNTDDWLGNSVSTAGDMNGDGQADLVLGAMDDNNPGKVYVIFGVTLPSPMPQPTTLPNAMIAPQPTLNLMPQPTALPNMMNSPQPAPSTPANHIPLNLTACSLNQVLQWLYHDIFIANMQRLRLSPMDIAARCGGNTSQPYLATYFSVTGMHSATLQQRNASGEWNVVGFTFFGYDLANGNVELVHDGSQVAPELNITATDGLTTLFDQPIQVNFRLTDNPPALVSFQLTLSMGDRVTLNTSNIIVTTTNGKPTNLILYIDSIQNGYFTQIDAPDVSINEFTYYQLLTGQIQIVHNGGNQPITFNMRVSDGLESSILQPETVVLFNFGKADEPIRQIGSIVGGAVAGIIFLVGGLAAFGLYYHKEKKNKQRINHMKKLVKLGNEETAIK